MAGRLHVFIVAVTRLRSLLAPYISSSYRREGRHNYKVPQHCGMGSPRVALLLGVTGVRILQCADHAVLNGTYLAHRVGSRQRYRSVQRLSETTILSFTLFKLENVTRPMADQKLEEGAFLGHRRTTEQEISNDIPKCIGALTLCSARALQGK